MFFRVIQLIISEIKQPPSLKQRAIRLTTPGHNEINVGSKFITRTESTPRQVTGDKDDLNKIERKSSREKG